MPDDPSTPPWLVRAIRVGAAAIVALAVIVWVLASLRLASANCVPDAPSGLELLWVDCAPLDGASGRFGLALALLLLSVVSFGLVVLLHPIPELAGWWSLLTLAAIGLARAVTNPIPSWSDWTYGESLLAMCVLFAALLAVIAVDALRTRRRAAPPRASVVSGKRRRP